MGTVVPVLHAFSGGEVSKIAFGRTDVDRIRLKAEEQINWMPRKLGPMSLRPGLEYLGGTDGDNVAVKLPFVSSIDNKATLEFTNNKLRIWVDDELVTRPAVSTSVQSSSFQASTGWSLTGSGASISSDRLRLIANTLGSSASAQQQVTVAGGDQNVRHGLRIVVERGPVQFRVGSSSGGEQYIKETTLRTGRHHLSFVPTGNFFINFSTTLRRTALVSQCTIEQDTTLEIVTPYTVAKIPLIRYCQSADVMFIACAGLQQRRIERRSQHSWSIVLYQPEDGPFLPVASSKVSLSPSGTTGNITITADAAFFRQGHVGALLRLFQTQEKVTATISAANNFSDPIRVTGVKAALKLLSQNLKPNTSQASDDDETGETGDTVGSGKGSIVVDHKRSNTTEARSAQSGDDAKVTKANDKKLSAGTRRFRYRLTKNNNFNGRVSLQRSFDGPDVGFSRVRLDKPDIRLSLRDQFDNSVVWYRFGVETGNFGSTGSSQSVTGVLEYPHGGGAGVVRITGFTSDTEVTAEVLEPLSSTQATRDWQEGMWSDRQGWPSSCMFFGGRLWWFGNDTCWGSVSDAYDSFDYEMEGDAAPVIRSIGEGPVQAINSAVPLRRPILFGTGSEISIRSNSLEEPLTPTNFGLTDISTQGSANVQAVKVDGRAIYVQRSKRRILQILYQLEQQDYSSVDLTALHPDLGSADFTKLAVQRQPETLIHVVRGDGTVCCLLLEPNEEVVAWWRIETDGDIEDVCVLPGTPEDCVYYVVKRVINGSTKRYVEKFALLSQCVGGTLNRQLDSFKSISQSSSTTISGLTHLEGETVGVWANGKDLGTYTVSGGSITVSEAVTTAIVGLVYTATYKSTKLAYGAERGTALTQKKRIPKLGLILVNTHYQGVQYGQDFTNMWHLPKIEGGEETAAHTVWETYDKPMIELGGDWDTDARLCLKATAPRPATVCAAILAVETRDSIGPAVRNSPDNEG